MYDGLDSRWEDDVDSDVLYPLDDATGNPLLPIEQLFCNLE